MAREDHQLKFRVPDGLKQALESAAEANKRSMNAEIIARLEASFKIGEADETYRALAGDGDGFGSRLQELSSLLNEITSQARQARRLVEPVPLLSIYGQIQDDSDLSIQPPAPEAVSLTRDELYQLRDDEREAEGKPRRYGPRPTGEAGARLDWLWERAEERRKLFQLERLLVGKPAKSATAQRAADPEIDETERRIADVAERLKGEAPKRDPRVGRARTIAETIVRKTK